MQIMHMVHCRLGCHADTCTPESQLDNAQKSHGSDAGENVAPYLAICPVAYRSECHLHLIFT